MSCQDPAETSQADTLQLKGAPTNTVVLSSEINWEALNPARGDKSPMAGTIWGNRKGEEATGFLAKFIDGFSSPPHIHNVSYRALVIKGHIHNDDSQAEEMWMSPGSFWTQPAGAPHITSAKGPENIAYVEIDSGPYLVHPTEDAFENGEKPVNVDNSNIVWVDARNTRFVETDALIAAPQVAFLWQQNGLNGFLFKFPPGFKGELFSSGDQFHAVIIAGKSNYEMPQAGPIKGLDPGSYFSSAGPASHLLTIQEDSAFIVYVRTNGGITFNPKPD